MTPNLTELLESAITSALARVRVAVPGVVKSYDATKARAEIIPAIQETRTLEDGTQKTETLPVITDVPVIFPGSGGRRIVWEIKPGDSVLLVFTSSSIDRWLARGGIVDPGVDRRRHDLSGAVALPGLEDFAHAHDAVPQIKFTSTEVQIGGTSSLVTRDEFMNHIHNVPGGTSNTPLVSITGTQTLKGG